MGFLLGFFIVLALTFIIYINIEYRKIKSEEKNEKTEEEKFQEWLDDQW